MSYIKTTWVTGDIVTAPRMNNMEGGIYNNDAAITELQSEVTDTQSDVSTLQTNVSTMQTNVSTLQSNVSTLQTNVTNLQTITGNLVPSIADVFSTSSTYAVGDHVMYNGRLYECKTAVTSAGAWNASAWEAVSVFKYDDVVGVIKITNTSTTMATVETTLAEINTANDHIVFDVSALSAGMHLCTIYLSDGKYRITDLATGFDGEGLYSSTDALVSILQKGSAPFYNVTTEPYTFRAINAGVGDKESLDLIVGGSLGWNQLVADAGRSSNGITTTFSNGVRSLSGSTSTTWASTATISHGGYKNGHVYYHSIYLSANPNALTLKFVLVGTDAQRPALSITAKNVGLYGGMAKSTITTSGDASSGLEGLTSGTNLGGITFSEGFYDLTQMFGSTIADYVYGLESATAGAGVAWLSKYIDLGTYHAYDAGSIQSVQATAHVMTGFNQWDEQWELGGLTDQGALYPNTDRIRSKNYIPILPNTAYYYSYRGNESPIFGVCYYDGNKNFIGSRITFSKNNAQTSLANARYMKFYVYNASPNITTYANNICINISKTTGTPKNGDYVPYNGHTYPLGSDTLRGVPQLVSNKLAFDGDIKTPDGTTRRRYGIVDLGSLNWTRETSANSGWRFYSIGFNLHKKTGAGVVPNMICPKYITVTANQTWNNVTGISNNGTNPSLTVCDTAYSDAASFKTAMSGVYLVYELETYTTEFLSAYQRVQEAPQGGTEAFTTESIVPVGHSTRNPGNMLAAVELVGDDKEEDPIYSEDSTPYTLRKVENRGVAGKCALNKLVGGSLGWNQLIGGATTSTLNGVTFTNNGNGSWTITGTQNATNTFKNISPVLLTEKVILENHVYYISGCNSRVYMRLTGNGSTGLLTQTSVPTIRKITSIYGATGTWVRFQIADNVTTINETLTPQVLDLTAMFGSTIADYIYSLESATAGAGVAWLSQYIDLSTYHAYDAGSIQNVQATEHVTLSKNFLTDYEGHGTTYTISGVTFTQNSDGTITLNGTATAAVTYYLAVRQRNFYLPKGSYILSGTPTGYIRYTLRLGINRGADGATIGNDLGSGFAFTEATGETYGVWIAFDSGAVFNNVVMKPMVRYATADSTYVPYQKHTYFLGSDTLRGIPQLVSNKLQFDGDIKTPDGTIRRRYGIVDLGTLNWTHPSGTGMFYTTGLSAANDVSGRGYMCSSYVWGGVYSGINDASAAGDKKVTAYTGSDRRVWIRDDSYTSSTAEAFKAAMSGKYLVYPLTTETTESSTSYQRIQTIDGDGTESFTTSTPVPVGHETQYAENILAEIDAIGDGLDDIGEEKAVAIPNSAITMLETNANITENGLHIYKNMVSGWLVIKRGDNYTQSSTHIADIDKRYVPKTRQRILAGEGTHAYDIQAPAYVTLPPQGVAEAGQIYATQNSTTRPYLFIHLDYLI